MTPKTFKIIGLVTTGFLSLLLLPSGVMQAIAHEEVLKNFHRFLFDNVLLMRWMGVLKIAAAIGLWVPKGRPWAFHGLVFLFTGAMVAHVGISDPPQEFIGATVIMVLTLTSEYCTRKSGMLTSSSSLHNRAAA